SRRPSDAEPHSDEVAVSGTSAGATLGTAPPTLSLHPGLEEDTVVYQEAAHRVPRSPLRRPIARQQALPLSNLIVVKSTPLHADPLSRLRLAHALLDYRIWIPVHEGTEGRQRLNTPVPVIRLLTPLLAEPLKPGLERCLVPNLLRLRHAATAAARTVPPASGSPPGVQVEAPGPGSCLRP
ncbi:hypothetical protein LCGC14_2085010, partial [marine sediment metagenome]